MIVPAGKVSSGVELVEGLKAVTVASLGGATAVVRPGTGRPGTGTSGLLPAALLVPGARKPERDGNGGKLGTAAGPGGTMTLVAGAGMLWFITTLVCPDRAWR